MRSIRVKKERLYSKEKGRKSIRKHDIGDMTAERHGEKEKQHREK
jgi:hypothetical protein